MRAARFLLVLVVQHLAVFWEHYFRGVGFPWDFSMSVELRRVLRSKGRVLLSVFFAEHHPSREAIDFFHEPSVFLATVAQAGFVARPREPQIKFG